MSDLRAWVQVENSPEFLKHAAEEWPNIYGSPHEESNMIPSHELKHLPIAEAIRVQQESIGADVMIDARQEVCILRAQLAASRDRELSLDATIRELRRELLEAHDIAGRAEGAASAKSVPAHDWTRTAEIDRRRLGA